VIRPRAVAPAVRRPDPPPKWFDDHWQVIGALLLFLFVAAEALAQWFQ
jgi:hypothetical protein